MGFMDRLKRAMNITALLNIRGYILLETFAFWAWAGVGFKVRTP